MIFKLDQNEVLTIASMCQVLSGMAVSSLKYLNPRPYSRDDPEITRLRGYVVDYMTLRNQLLRQLIAYQHGEKADTLENIRKDGLQAIANSWNEQIRRINGEPEKPCNGDACDL